MAVGLQSLFGQTPPPMGGMPAASAATTNPYAGFQWSSLDPTKIGNPQSLYGFDMSNLQSLGWTGNNPLVNSPVTSYDGGVNGNQQIETANWGIDPEFQKWMDTNGYTYGQSFQPDPEAGRGWAYSGILDKNGSLVGVPSGSHYDTNDSNLMKVSSYIPAAVGAIGGYNALANSGLFGGATGGSGSNAGLMEAMGGTSPVAGGGPTAGLGGFNAAMDSQAANAGGAAVWGNAGNGMTGSTVATNAPSAVDLGGLGGVMQTAGGAGGLVNAVGGNNPAAIPGGTKTLGDILKGVGGNLASNLTSPNGLAGLLGLLNANNQRNTWKDQMDELNKNFSVDSPYAQMMKQRLERTDSAAGRNSQYGTREVELAAKLAEAKANAVKDLISMQDRANSAQNSGIRDLATIFGGGNNSIFSGLSTGFQDLLKLIGDGG